LFALKLTLRASALSMTLPILYLLYVLSR
jgi:hypothetical protein